MTPILSDIPHLLIAILLGGGALVLPGLAWRAWFPLEEEDPLAWLADVLGLGIALYALGALALFLPKIQLTGPALAALLLLLLGLIALGWWQRGLPQLRIHPYHGLLIPLFALLLGWRLYQVRELVLPPWVDSLHHTLITDRILATGGLPETLKPALPVPFYYHYAFHLITAILSWIARLEPPQAVLLMGQLINAMISLTLYRLVRGITDDWRQGALAALISGFITHMPAYYATWGRYTLLTGLALLPLAIARAYRLGQSVNRRNWLELALLTGGLILSHYFAFGLFLSFLGIWVLLSWWKRSPKNRLPLVPLATALVTGIGLVSPWWIRTLSLTQASIGIDLAFAKDIGYEVGRDPGYIWYLLGPTRNHLFFATVLLSVAFLWRVRTLRPWILWTGMILFFSLPWSPQIRPFRPDHWTIVLFFPLSLLGAQAVFDLPSVCTSGKLCRVAGGLLALLIFLFVGWGLADEREIINPVTILAERSDMQAIAWVKENVPKEARFFINVEPWQYQVYRGVDGGWWLPLLTGRDVLLPPVVYHWGEADYVKQITQRAAMAWEVTSCSPEFWHLVAEVNLTHIYLKDGVGSLQPSGLEDCPAIKPIYRQGEISIHRITR
jgi:hypothetical protein